MARSQLQLISTDFDGTLIEVGAAPQPLHPAFFERLAISREQHPVTWAINTGRTLEELEAQLHLRCAPAWPDWVIVMERQIWRVHAEEKRLLSWEEWNERCTVVHNELFAVTKSFWKELEIYIDKETKTNIIMDSSCPFGLESADEEEADRISAYLEQALASWPDLMPVRNSVWIRFSHKEFHKGSCLQALGAMLKIERENRFAVGDGLNDLAMLQRVVAEHIACPANSDPRVKEHVAKEQGYLAKAEDITGVVEAWDHFAGNELD